MIYVMIIGISAIVSTALIKQHRRILILAKEVAVLNNSINNIKRTKR